jgi:hypothetical protein
MSPAGLEPTTYGLKVPDGNVLSSCGTEISDAVPEGAHYSHWLEQLAIAESKLSGEQQRFILAVVDREIRRSQT